MEYVSSALRAKIQVALRSTPKGKLMASAPGTMVTLVLKRWDHTLTCNILRCGRTRVTVIPHYRYHPLKGRKQQRDQLEIKYGDIQTVLTGSEDGFSRTRKSYVPPVSRDWDW